MCSRPTASDTAPNRAIGGLLKDIIANPCRPAASSPGWLTEALVSLAIGICANRAFDRMPILADAPEKAGCDSANLLTQCRGDGPHVLGCWAIDLLLGRE